MAKGVHLNGYSSDSCALKWINNFFCACVFKFSFKLPVVFFFFLVTWSHCYLSRSGFGHAAILWLPQYLRLQSNQCKSDKAVSILLEKKLLLLDKGPSCPGNSIFFFSPCACSDIRPCLHLCFRVPFWNITPSIFMAYPALVGLMFSCSRWRRERHSEERWGAGPQLL